MAPDENETNLVETPPFPAFNRSRRRKVSTDINRKDDKSCGINRSAIFYDLFYLLEIGRKADPFLLLFGRKPRFDHVAEKGF